MNVARLRELLAAYPDEMDVVCFVPQIIVRPGVRIPEVLTSRVDRLNRMRMRSGEEVVGVIGIRVTSDEKTGDTPENPG